mmetsp:Transcript_7417/g.23283  ORF Transcript_7417/g.23283 Transcript_7417/m.23283 type:complete len:632 (-) Transcript_7417:87-1982(-)
MEKKEGCYNIVFAVTGTRGDFQPYMSLALSLQKRGHRIKMYSAINHTQVATSFGLDAEFVANDISEGLNDENAMRAMEAGDFLLIAKGKKKEEGEEEKEELIEGMTREELLKLRAESYKEFKPDLYVTNGLGHIGEIYEAVPDVPYMGIALQPQGGPASNSFKHLMWARELPTPDTPFICTHIWSFQNMGKAYHETYQTSKFLGVPEEQLANLKTPDMAFLELFETDKQIVPQIMAYSPSVFPVPSDWPESNTRCVCGYLKLTKEEQDAQAKSGNAFFTEGTQHEDCTNFIAAGSTPVYVGWGSMIVYGSKHMTRLAVEALQGAGERGIILGGWAKLSIDDLDDLQELKEYAEKNVLFMKMAPHEWLFPQCKCCVHHGGIGTLQASLASGSPTIVTPVFADQESNAKALEGGRWGVGTTRLGLLKPDELAQAIRTVCSDSSYQERTTQLKEKMDKEDGIATSIKFIEDFLINMVVTGKYKQTLQEQKENFLKQREKKWLTPWDTLFAQYSSKLMRLFPPYKEYSKASMTLMTTVAEKTCWWVKASSCLVREGEGLKTKEVGRFKQFCFLEELAKKGNRIQVKKVSGWGPDQGWVSPTASGKDILEKVQNVDHARGIQTEMFNDLFKDIIQK